jgi:hypothetical protein
MGHNIMHLLYPVDIFCYTVVSFIERLSWGLNLAYSLFFLQLNSIVRRTIKEADKDKDCCINLEEFKQVKGSTS